MFSFEVVNKYTTCWACSYHFLKGQCYLLSDAILCRGNNMTDNIIWSLFIIFWNKNSKYFYKFILIEDSVLITATFVV